ncbi:MAG: hypothetical protein E4G97_03210 [Deltaproteobacteria bacterium]|nr:MAG: hypothetical protein E4G97_03210 [Deltaproteobacteria bacterium]
MNPKNLVGLIVLAVLGLATAGSSPAADQVVTFQVPVKLQSIHPDVTKPTIDCMMLGKDGGIITHSTKVVPISGGNYSGPPVSVPVNVTQGQAEIAAGWRCQLWLFPAAGSGYQPAQGSGLPLQQAKPGTPLVYKVEGKF